MKTKIGAMVLITEDLKGYVVAEYPSALGGETILEIRINDWATVMMPSRNFINPIREVA